LSIEHKGGEPPATNNTLSIPVLIPHYRAPNQCIRALRCLEAQGLPYHVKIIDNGSTDDELGRLESALPPDAEVIRPGTNLGWGGAFNVGLRHALLGCNAPLIALMSDDHYLSPDCLQLLIDAAAQNADAAIICAEFTSSLNWFTRFRGPVTKNVAPLPRGSVSEMHWPHGMMLLRVPPLREIGLFDERYFMYGEEVDFGLRVRRHGWKVIMVWGATLENGVVRSDTAFRSRLFTRNLLLLVREYGGSCQAGLRAALVIAMTLPRLLFGSSSDRPYQVARLAGVWDFLRGRWGAPQRQPRLVLPGTAASPLEAPLSPRT
jgi:glycosyltransferase involved in cell wall biosynthesis